MMDWSNERYVRIYCRDTVEWEMLPWESRALWPNLLRKVDRAGILPLGRYGVKGLAALVKLPIFVVEPGLAGLLDDGCLEQEGEILIVPNFIAAQESKQSDRQRQEESRARRRAAEAVTPSHNESQPVTNCDDESQNVTECHDQSQPVTIGHSVPCRALPCLALEDPPLPPLQGGIVAGDDPADPGSDPPKRTKTPSFQAEVSRVSEAVRVETGIDYGAANWNALRQRFRQDKLPVDDALLVVEYLARTGHYWRQQDIPPLKVFSPQRVAELLPKARAWKAGTLRTQSKPTAHNPYRLVTD